MKLDELLTSRDIDYERLHHDTCYSANRCAEKLHVPGKMMAKSVLLRTQEGYVLVVLPATHRVDLGRIRQFFGFSEIASEEEMEQVFPDCECGAMPPFGSLYHIPTLVDQSLTEDVDIVFEANNHHQAIRMHYKDFDELEHPRVGHFALPV